VPKRTRRLRYRLTLRDLAEMFLVRGLVFSHEAVREWEAKLVPLLAEELRRRRHGKRSARGRDWHVDETYLKLRGRWAYLYRAIDRDGTLVDAMRSEPRDMPAAQTFFSSAKAATGVTPARHHRRSWVLSACDPLDARPVGGSSDERDDGHAWS
jgi:transposase-like protein